MRATIRRPGRRPVATTTVLGGLTVLLVIAAATGCRASDRNSPAPPAGAGTTAGGGGGQVSPHPPTAATTPRPGPTTAAPRPPTLAPRPTVPGGGLVFAPPCQPTDLTARWEGGGAMGSAIYSVTVTNRGTRTCVLSGYPTLLATNLVTGRLFVIPQEPHPISPIPAPVVLHRGDRAFVMIRTVNGYGGYPTDSPHCAHPVTYRGIYLVIGAGRCPLAGLVLAVLCDGVSSHPWQAVPA